MINDNTILSSFDDKPTLLEWLKKVEDALKTDTAKSISVENPSPNTYVFKITFADGDSISSGNVVFPDSVKDVSIKNGHIIVTQISGTQTDLGVINPYAGTIVVNAETNTTEIGGKLQVTGNVAMGGNLGVTGQAVVGGGLSVNGALGVTGNATIGGRLQADSSIISNGEIRGGNISGTKFLLGTEEMPLVKANPTGEATQTLEKIKIGDVAYNVGGGGGGGSDYTAGKNITISEAKEISIPDDIVSLKSISILKQNESGKVTLTQSFDHDLTIKTVNYQYFPSLRLTSGSGFSVKDLRVRFDNVPLEKIYQLSFDFDNLKEGFVYPFISRTRIPDVPTADGTYVLKAIVSNGNLSYSWELQQ